MKRKLYIFLIKTIFALPLLIFGIWLLQILYAPGLLAKKPAAQIQVVEQDGIIRKKYQGDDPLARGHFHMVDETMTQPEPYQPICLSCHGTFPHSKEKKVRSLLNLHTGFMACAVCHFRKDPADKTFTFIWVDRAIGLMSSAVEGGYGKYPAKIFPMRTTAEGREAVIRPVSEKSAREFIKLKEKYSPDQIAQAKSKLHEQISKKPVSCVDCHKKDGYLNFANLGFPRNRVNYLASSEVAGMIEKYETFYLPEVIDFGDNQ